MIQTVNVNVAAQPTSGGPESFLVLSQNENGRQIRFRILGDDLPAGCTATFSGTKPDGNVYSASGTIDGNFVLLSEEIQMTAVAGRWDAKLSIAKGTENIMTSLIRVTVVADAVSGDAIPSDSELDGIVAECRSYAEAAKNEAYGSPLTASTAAAMTDQSRVYVYTGSESGMTAGHWYYYNGTTWADGGVYNAIAVDTDTTLSIAGKAADAKKVGDELADVKEDFNGMVNSAYVTDSANGAVAHFVDGADDVPMKSVKVNIAPVQSGSGDPSPSNVRAISGKTSVTVTRAGKNVFPSKGLTQTLNGITIHSNDDGSFTVNGTATANAQFDLTLNNELKLQSGQYTVGMFADKAVTFDNQHVWWFFYSMDAHADIVNCQTPSKTFTLNAVTATRFYLMIISGATVDNVTFYPMLVYGSDAPTEYEPYNGNTYGISLASAGTVYGGTLDVVSGELVVDRGIITLDGSQTITESQVKRFYVSIPDARQITAENQPTDDSVISERFKSYTWSALSNATDGCAPVYGFGVGFRNPNITDVASWTAFFRENPTKFSYMLAAPLTYQLSATEIKSLLGINNVWSDAGDMDVEYRADTKLYIDKRLGV